MDTFYNYGRMSQEDAGPAPAESEQVYVPQPEPQPEQVYAPQPEPQQEQVYASQPEPQPEQVYASQPEPEQVYAPQPEPQPVRHSEPFYTYSAPEPYRYVPERTPPRKSQKESPYANSPYVMNSPQPEYRYQPQTAPKAPKAPKAPRKKGGFWRSALAMVLVAALIAGGCLITASTVSRRWEAKNAQDMALLNQRIQQLEEGLSQSNEPAECPAPIRPASGTGMTPAEVYAQNVSSVVAIAVVVGQEGTSAGSGFILTDDGYVVTNQHVIDGGTSIAVVMNDGTELPAKLVGQDATNDVAVLKVEATGLPAVRLGSSNDLAVGDMVVAIGNPLGELNSTQTVGYICGKDREVTTGGTIISMLQTDAAINPGNSGGPLFNMNGEVVGITTAKYSGTTTSGASIEGIGFALPIDDIRGIISDLQTYGYVTGAYLGITVQNVDPSFTASYGISGAVIISVEPGYAAQRAGLQAKDIITALNGTPITSITDLTRGLRAFKAGDTVTLTIVRNGVQQDVPVTLDEKPQNLQQPTQPAAEPEMPSEGDYEEWYDYFRRYFGE